jgi:hypothetical protein
MMVEPSRKHGPFDSRYPALRRLPPPVWELTALDERGQRLDWAAFAARFYPGGRRHDLEAIAGYGAYRSSLDDAPTAPEASVMAWEWDGGAVGGPSVEDAASALLAVGD